MRLRELCKGGPLSLRSGSDSTDVARVDIDSRKVARGSLFVAVRGVALDGHDYLPMAVTRGASVLVVEEPSRVPPDFAGTVVETPDARAALNHLASRFFGDPGLGMFCVGVTGTDGKTTVTWLVEAVLAGCGIPTGVIGTVDHHFGEHRWPGETTPPPLALQERLSQLHALGARAVALEATSQGLSQSRISSVPLDVALFTNLTRDHLDYHRTLDAYFDAKQRLFTEALAHSIKPARHAIVNLDTSFGTRIQPPRGATLWTYAREGTPADFHYALVASGLSGSVFRLRHREDEAELRLPMIGEFNGANAIAAIATGVAAGHPFQACVRALDTFAGVPGRVQRVGRGSGRDVFVDYAHDPDAVQKLTTTVRDTVHRERPGATLVTLFGCGGDRDRGKRPLMLQAALSASDRVVLTSDNPRSEDPARIAEEVLRGLDSRPSSDRARVVVELDRKKAIHLALESTREGDVVLLLGKGHEPYQIVGEQRLPHSDYAIAAAKLEELEAR
jgi:UDP-N-acetylmuramoyl-L-alanyl-D-glutamate--2,6-diaminopimelate ligase